jgi:O-antigen/teichoic acid export membrane protein
LVTAIKNSATKFRSLVHQGSARSVNIKKNLLLSFLFKGMNIVIGLALVPLTIDFVSPTQYGIWLTLSSIFTWVSFFDIGLGNGLRNKFAEALAHNKLKLARIYVSTTYAVLSVIIGAALILFLFVNPFLNWNVILNAPDSPESELSKLALVVFTFFCLHFILQLVITVATANQQPAKGSVIGFISNFFSLAVIFILTKLTKGNIFLLGVALSGTSVFVLIIASIYLFKGEYRKFAPSLKLIRLRYTKLLTNIGLKFFVIQIAAIVLFQSNNIIISHIFGPAEVTPYNIAYRYFGIVTMIASMIMTPLWSAFTDSWHKKDYLWIKSTISKLQKLWLVLAFVTLIMVVLSPFAYNLWVGDRITIPFVLSVCMGLHTLIFTWNMIYIQFINGVGKIQLQLYSGIFGTILTIPLTYLFADYFSLSGIVIASCVLGLINTSWTYVQYQKLIEHKATGLWNK